MDRVPVDALERFQPRSRAEWRDWLARHHDASQGVWLVLHKRRPGPPLVTLEEAVREALCFGWIDSRLRPLDAATSALLFTPRRRGSTWSRSNRERVAELTAQGLMTDAGRRVVDAAHRDGSWEALAAAEQRIVPEDLAAALDADERARTNFEAFAPSAQQHALWWIESAKRPQTRARRIAETVRLAAGNRTVAARDRGQSRAPPERP